MTAARRLRIASLVPSLTELVVHLGLGPQLVARTGFCIHPRAALETVAKVGGTKDVNLQKLHRLAPSHVLVNVDENRLDTIDAIRGWDASVVPEIIVTHPTAPEHNLDLIDQLVMAFGTVAGVADRGVALQLELQRELLLTRPDARPPQRVLYLIWHAPWMTVARDTYISRMLARVNWQTVPEVDGGESGAARYPALTGREGWLEEVEQVLLSSEPYRFQSCHFAAAQALCPLARVRRVDGEALSWYGSRALLGLRYLRDLADGSLPDAPGGAGENDAWRSSSR